MAPVALTARPSPTTPQYAGLRTKQACLRFVIDVGREVHVGEVAQAVGRSLNVVTPALTELKQEGQLVMRVGSHPELRGPGTLFYSRPAAAASPGGSELAVAAPTGRAAATASAGSRAEHITHAFLISHLPSTRAVYSRSLSAWARWCADRDVDLLDAQRSDVECWMRELEEAGLSPGTRVRHLAALRGFYLKAVDQEAITVDPVARVARPHVGRDKHRLGLDRDEARALLVAAESAVPRDRAFIALLLCCGLRVGEAVGIDVRDIRTVRGQFTVTVVREGGAHLLPLPPLVVVAVRRLLDEDGSLRQPTSALFLDSTGQRLDRFEAGRIVRRLVRAAGITKAVSPNSLRRTFITLALDAGANLSDVQHSVGHADPGTTLRYARRPRSLKRFAGYDVTGHIAALTPAGRTARRRHAGDALVTGLMGIEPAMATLAAPVDVVDQAVINAVSVLRPVTIRALGRALEQEYPVRDLQARLRRLVAARRLAAVTSNGATLYTVVGQ